MYLLSGESREAYCEKCASLEDHNHVGNEAEFLAEKNNVGNVCKGSGT